MTGLRGLRKARDRIDRDYAEPAGIGALAAEAGYSPAHFIRAFRAAYGETPGAYRTRINQEVTMITGLSFVSVWVLDQDSARDFYTAKLGCELTSDLQLDNGMRWLTVRPRAARARSCC